MKRRAFIDVGLKVLPSSLLLPNIWACDKIIEPNGIEVLVIGAGIAGLAAAKDLSENGYTVKVLEASEKIGGRLKTDRSLGLAFDQGASWIHGIKGNPISDLASKAGMSSFPCDDESIISYDIGNTPRSKNEFLEEEEAFYNVLKNLYKKGEAGESFAESFRRLYPDKVNDRLWRFFLSTYLTFDTGDLDQLSSTLYFEGEEFSGGENLAINGYDKIPEYLAKNLNIQLTEMVSAIDYSQSKIKVLHSSGLSEADFVIITVPLGVLKANSIRFTPALSTPKLEAIEKIGMNCVNKFLLKWDTAFWDDKLYLSYTPEIADQFNYFVNLNHPVPGSNCLMTFAYADKARASENLSDNSITETIMSHLKDMYGENIPEPTALLRTKWQTNPYCLGSYSYTSIKTKMEHFDQMAEAEQSKLFFAGEHTDRDYFSTAHGAYLSGIREAKKIMKVK